MDCTTTVSGIEKVYGKILSWIRCTYYTDPGVRFKPHAFYPDVNKSADLNVEEFLGGSCVINFRYMNQITENDDVFISWSFLVLVFNYLFMQRNIETRFEVDKFQSNYMYDTDNMHTEMKKLKRRYLKTNHLLLEMQSDQRACFTLHRIIKEMCICYINILGEVGTPIDEDVSFLLPHTWLMPSVKFDVLSQTVSKGIVRVEAFTNMNVARSVLKPKKFVRAVWEDISGIWSLVWCNSYYDTRLESMDKLYCLLESALERINTRDTVTNMDYAECKTEHIYLYLLCRLWLGGRTFDIIPGWILPPDSASLALNTLPHDSMPEECHGDPMKTVMAGFILLLLKQNKESDVTRHVFLRSLKFAIPVYCRTQPCQDTNRAFSSILRTCKKRDLLTVQDVKMLAVYSIKQCCIPVLDIVINLYPWIAKTWIDEVGNTLLGLAVLVRWYDKDFIEHLVRKAPVFESIDMLSRDHLLTPAMLYVGPKLSPLKVTREKYGHYSGLSLLFEAGAKMDIVNENGESILHRAASYNNCELLSFISKNEQEWEGARFSGKSLREILLNVVNVRRKHDGCTPIMISLARSHLRFSSNFLSLFKPKLGILMGKSEALRVWEYLFLNGMEQELEVLGGFSCGRVARVLNEAKAKNPGYDLWREQFLCGGAGSLVEGEGGKYLYCPSLTPGRDIFPRLLPSKRPEWLRDFMEGDMEKFRAFVLASRPKIFNADDKECPVCMTEFRNNINVTPCGHQLCHACVERLCSGHFEMKCPYCNKTDVSRSSILPMELYEEEKENYTVTKQRKWKLLSENRYAFFVEDRWIDEKDL